MKGIELGIAAWNEWAQHGVKVFPCGMDKRPLCKWKSEASDDKAEVLKLFGRAGDKATAIGAAMGEHCGLFVLDFDTHKDIAAVEFQQALQASGMLPRTRVHKTQNGGEHWFYFGPENVDIPRNGVPSAGVDIRGEGGYVLVPPTPGYTVVSDETTVAPENLVARLNSARKAFNSSSISQLKRKIIEGENFHEAATLIAAKLSGAGKDPEFIAETIRSALKSSVAGNENHPRHSRWRALAEDKDGELGRILGSAYAKFNPQKADDDIAGLSDKVHRNSKVTKKASLQLFGAPPQDDPSASPRRHQPADVALDMPVGDFPFKNAYAAADVYDQNDKAFLIYPLIMEGDTVVLSAKPKEGKTLTAMNLALHAAAGIEIDEELKPLDKAGKVSKIPIVYFALEGQGAIRKRIRGWLDYQLTVHDRNLKKDDLWLYVVEESINLADDEAKQKVVDRLALADAYFKRTYSTGIGLVVFDTLTKAMPGKDQNSVEDTSSVFQTIDTMRWANLECAVMFIHHNDKAGKGPRGSSNILAEPDTILTVEKMKPIVVDDDYKDVYGLSVMMARAIDDSLHYKFMAHRMEIGKNSQGIMETAPVLEAMEDYDVQHDVDEDKLRKAHKKASTAFYATVFQILSGATDMTLPPARLHRQLVNELAPEARAFYVSHINDKTKGGIITALKVLLSEHQVPEDLKASGVVFSISDNEVELQTRSLDAVVT